MPIPYYPVKFARHRDTFMGIHVAVLYKQRHVAVSRPPFDPRLLNEPL